MQRTLQLIRGVSPREIANEALLSKPPFRFLHDVTMELMMVTGFGMGLWDGVEMDALALRSGEQRDAKLRFLWKLIAIACAGKQYTACPVPFRPSSILSGSDPEFTNILLQVKRVQTALRCC